MIECIWCSVFKYLIISEAFCRLYCWYSSPVWALPVALVLHHSLSNVIYSLYFEYKRLMSSLSRILCLFCALKPWGPGPSSAELFILLFIRVVVFPPFLCVCSLLHPASMSRRLLSKRAWTSTEWSHIWRVLPCLSDLEKTNTRACTHVDKGAGAPPPSPNHTADHWAS